VPHHQQDHQDHQRDQKEHHQTDDAEDEEDAAAGACALGTSGWRAPRILPVPRIVRFNHLMTQPAPPGLSISVLADRRTEETAGGAGNRKGAQDAR
jgi:hypothetical protein